MMCIDFKVSGEYSENTILCNSLPAMDRGIEILTKDNPEVFDDIKKREIFNYIKDNQRTGKEERDNILSEKAEEILLFLFEKISKKCKILYTRFIKLRVVKERRIL